MITTISPSPPLGPYPQFRLCGQAGTTPNSNKIRTISRMVPSMVRSFKKRLRESERIATTSSYSQPDSTLRTDIDFDLDGGGWFSSALQKTFYPHTTAAHTRLAPADGSTDRSAEVSSTLTTNRITNRTTNYCPALL